MQLKSICLFSLLLISLYFPTILLAEDQNTYFNQLAKDVEKIKNSNLTLAYDTLIVFKTKLAKLTLKQRIVYYQLLSDIYIEQAQFAIGKTTVNKGLELTKKLSSPSIAIAHLLYSRGFALESLGDIKKATFDYERGLEVSESLHDKIYIAQGLINLGAIYYLTDRYERSLTALMDAYNISRQTDDEVLKGYVNAELGILYSYLNEKSQSMIYYQQSYQHFKNAGQIINSHNSLYNIAITHVNKSEYEKAIAIFKTIIDESEGVIQDDMMYSVYSGMSFAYLEKKDKDPEAAYQYLMLAKQYMDGIEQYDIDMNFYVDLASVLYALKRYDEAISSLETVEKVLKESQSFNQMKKSTYIRALTLKSAILYAQKKYQQAYFLRSKGLAITIELEEQQNISSVATVRLELESEQADLHKKMLEDKEHLNNLAFIKAQQEYSQQKYYLTFISVVALIFAWLIVRLIQNKRQLSKISNIDVLTGISNRRNLLKQGSSSFMKAKHKSENFSVLMIDVDHFKSVNDRLGHSGGDEILKTIARLGVELMRKGDSFGRMGGEEFIAFLPKTSKEEALIIAEKFRALVHAHPWRVNYHIEITISIGVASLSDFSPHSIDLKKLMKYADERMYQTINKGINQVCG